MAYIFIQVKSTTRSIYYQYGFWLQIYKWLNKKIRKLNLFVSTSEWLKQWLPIVAVFPAALLSLSWIYTINFQQLKRHCSISYFVGFSLEIQWDLPQHKFLLILHAQFVNHISSIGTAPQFHILKSNFSLIWKLNYHYANVYDSIYFTEFVIYYSLFGS